MTSWKILVAGICLAILTIVGSIALFEDNPRWDILAILTGVMLGGLVLVFGVAALLLRGLHGNAYQGFSALAEAVEGQVVGNFIGEKQVRATHPSGTLVIDFRVTAHVYADPADMRHDNWTRFALEGSDLAREARALDWQRDQVSAGEERPSDRAIRDALDVDEYPIVRVVLSPDGDRDGPAGVAIWLFGQITDESALLAAWQRVEPLLVELDHSRRSTSRG